MKKSTLLIGLFVLGLVFMLAFCESANADWSVEEQHDSNAGTTDFNAGLDRLCVRYRFDTGTSGFGCPVVAVGGDVDTGSFEIGITDEIGDRWEGEVRLMRFRAQSNGGVTVRRMVGDGPFRMGIGVTQWIKDSFGSGSDMTFNLSLRWTFQ